VRGLETVGVPRTTARKLAGHKTESIYRRYAIVSQAEMKDAAAKLEGIIEERTDPPLSDPSFELGLRRFRATQRPNVTARAANPHSVRRRGRDADRSALTSGVPPFRVE